MKNELIRRLCAITLAALTITGASVGAMAVSAKEPAQTTQISASATWGVYKNFEWVEKNDGGEKQVVIKKYKGNGKNVAVPEMINGMKVTEIGSAAFNDNTTMETVTIPKYVTSIAQRAFDGASTLKKIKVSSDNKNYSSKRGMLFNALGDTLFRVPEAYDAFVYLDPDVKTLKMGAFDNCSSVIIVEIRGRIENIDAYVFSNCPRLSEINFKGGIEGGGYHLYCMTDRCPELSMVNILQSSKDVKSAAYSTFDGIIYENRWDPQKKMMVPNKLVKCPEGRLGKVNVPETVTEILFNAFEYCYQLDSVEMGKNVKYIDESSFKESGVANVIISKANPYYRSNNGLIFESASIYNIPDREQIETKGYVKKGETLLCCLNTKKSKIAIPSTVKRIAPFAFSHRNMNEVIIPESVEEIGEFAFENCIKLGQIKIPSKVKIIRMDTFSGCKNLRSVDLGSGVESIEYGAFAGCYNLLQIKTRKMKMDIDDTAFNGCYSATFYGKAGSLIRKYAKDHNIGFSSDAPEIFCFIDVDDVVENGKKKLNVHCQAVNGDGGYTYTIQYKKVSSSKWINVQQNSKVQDVVIYPKADAWYEITVTVTDKSGEKASSGYSLNTSYIV